MKTEVLLIVFSYRSLTKLHCETKKQFAKTYFSVFLGYIERLNELTDMKFDQEFTVKNQNFHKFEV